MQQTTYKTLELRAEFTALIEAHRRIVLRIAHSYARSTADVQDLAQEIAAQLWRAFPTYDRTRRFSTWMYRIALNVAISWLRVEGPRRHYSVPYEALLHEPATAAETDNDDGQRILRGFIDAQGPLDRAVLLLYLEEHSYAQMAEILGVSETSLTTKMNRLKERLRSYAEKRHGTG